MFLVGNARRPSLLLRKKPHHPRAIPQILGSEAIMDSSSSILTLIIRNPICNLLNQSILREQIKKECNLWCALSSFVSETITSYWFPFLYPLVSITPFAKVYGNCETKSYYSCNKNLYARICHTGSTNC